MRKPEVTSRKHAFFLDKERKQYKGKQQILHFTNDEIIYQKISEWTSN